MLVYDLTQITRRDVYGRGNFNKNEFSNTPSSLKSLTLINNDSLIMSEVDYQHECSRAELLGHPKPTREDFFAKQKELKQPNENEIEEELTAGQVEEEDIQREGFRRLGGGLDELNSILTSTQKKLNRFKTVCGSFSNLLKLHYAKKEENTDVNNPEFRNEGGVVEEFAEVKKGDDSHLGKLDSLISKAERAEVSLSRQNKQMKKFLN